MIASEAPGLGDPWDLTPAAWDQTLSRISEAAAMASGNDTAMHGANIVKMKRKGRWRKLLAKLM